MRPKPFRSDRYLRRTLALFFIVSLIPALVVAAIWYVNSSSSSTSMLLNFQTYVLPTMVLGVLPALILSLLFAELLARPVRRIHNAVEELARGNYKAQFRERGISEFADITIALDHVSTRLQQTLSEYASETALIEAERGKLHTVLNSMTDGVFALDRSGRIVLFNKAASDLTGREITQVAGQLAEKVMPFRSNGELIITRQLANQGGTGHNVGEWQGLELYRADGTSLYVNVEAVTLTADPNGIATLITFHDLTKTRQLEEMKIDFVALAAHELRTPLTEIKGYLDILEHEAKNLSKTNRGFLNQAILSADTLSNLMHNLLSVARIEHGELGFRPEPINYAQFMKTLVTDLQSRATQEKRQLKLKAPSNLPTVFVDPSALSEVMTNLIDNAFHHTAPTTGQITITIGRWGDEVETIVQDNGVGIPASVLPRLFTKFFRGNEVRSNIRGTGLGLYICKSILEAQGGAIWADSTEGEGATFTFRLPLAASVAQKNTQEDNKSTTKITRRAHGWIKEHSIH